MCGLHNYVDAIAHVYIIYLCVVQHLDIMPLNRILCHPNTQETPRCKR